MLGIIGKGLGLGVEVRELTDDVPLFSQGGCSAGVH